MQISIESGWVCESDLSLGFWTLERLADAGSMSLSLHEQQVMHDANEVEENGQEPVALAAQIKCPHNVEDHPGFAASGSSFVL